MDPHRSFSNSIVKGYSGEDTKRGAFWENNTMSKFSLVLVITYTCMESYAIVQASGKQFWVEENKFYDFDKLPLDRGDTFSLNQVLLVNKENSVAIGKPFLDGTYKVEAVVLRHLSGPKIRVYKMRPKKKTRKTFGSRRKLTRVLINSISKK
jgi:large subunit ribosomal protein L21